MLDDRVLLDEEQDEYIDEWLDIDDIIDSQYYLDTKEIPIQLYNSIEEYNVEKLEYANQGWTKGLDY